MKNKKIYLVLLSLLLVGCSSKSETTQTNSMIGNSMGVTSSESNNISFGSNNMMVEDVDINYDSSLTVPQIEEKNDGLIETSSLNSKVIKTGELQIETLAFDKTLEELLNTTYKYNGFIQNMNKDSYNGIKSAYITIRIPNNYFDTYMNTTLKEGTILQSEIETQDITSIYVDNENRLKSLQVRYDRLLELLTKSDDLDKLFKVEQELANVNYEIENIKGTLNKYDNLVNYSSISISLKEVKNISPIPTEKSFKEELNFIAKEALLYAKNTFENLSSKLVYIGIVFVLVVLPIIMINIILIWLIIKIVKKYLKYRQKNKKNDDLNSSKNDEGIK